MSPADRQALRDAVNKLENPSFVVELASFIGVPLRKLVRALPDRYAARTQQITQRAIHKALDIAVKSLGAMRPISVLNRLHAAATVISGGVGGSLGIASTLVELPVTTVIMLRSIAEIARREGEDLTDPAARLACLEVFAFGGPGPDDDAADAGYYAVRASLAKTVSRAAKFIAERGLTDRGAPAVVRLVTQIASRFGVAVSEKAAAQALPIVGALGGAAVNLLFMSHFQKMAQGHFTVRRLERKYGEDVVRRQYDTIRAGITPPEKARPAALSGS